MEVSVLVIEWEKKHVDLVIDSPHFCCGGENGCKQRERGYDNKRQESKGEEKRLEELQQELVQ